MTPARKPKFEVGSKVVWVGGSGSLEKVRIGTVLEHITAGIAAFTDLNPGYVVSFGLGYGDSRLHSANNLNGVIIGEGALRSLGFSEFFPNPIAVTTSKSYVGEVSISYQATGSYEVQQEMNFVVNLLARLGYEVTLGEIRKGD